MRQIISVFLLLGVIAVPLTDVLAEFYGQRCSVSAIIGRAVGGRRSGIRLGRRAQAPRCAANHCRVPRAARPYLKAHHECLFVRSSSFS